MRSATHNYLHNPFQNRFNDPVSQRRDDMQADANVVWLRERREGSPINSSASRGRNELGQSSDWLIANLSGRVFAGIFSLLIIVLVSVVVLKAF